MGKKSNNETLSRTEAAHTPANRPDRVPFAAGSKLDVASRFVKKGYHPYLFIDRPGEIEAAKAAWYEHVKNEHGENVTIPAGNDETHYLMQLPDEYFKADQKKEQDGIDARMKTQVEIKSSEYSPESKDTALSKDPD